MSASIYLLPNENSELSKDGLFTNPFSITFDGRSGGTKQARLYVRNNDALYYYTSLTLTSRDLTAQPITERPEDGYVWKLSEGDTQPTQAEWNNIAAANTITLPDIGALGVPDTSTYLPFWIYIQVPPGLDVQTFDHVQFVLQGEENLVA